MDTVTDWSELQVPGEPGVWRCARHKNVQTRLRCGRCEKPICPKCTVMAPTGARCRDCVSNRTAHMYQVEPRHLAMAFAASVVAGAIGPAAIALAGSLWIWALLYAPALGPLLGRLVTTITKGKRGPKVASAVTVGLIVGAIGSAFASTSMTAVLPGDQFGEVPFSFLLTLTLFSSPLWIFLVVAIAGAWWWLK